MSRLGRYELGPVLGEGGSGRVHHAELLGPAGLRKPVALKVLLRGGESLRREARLGGLLRHRNLVDVYEIGEADGQWFCAMELCIGSLAQRLPLPPRAVVEVGLQVCAALQYAHRELQLVHLDLKPANLLFSADGLIKVADLGIARAEGFDLGGIRGTRGYMAPEQIRGGAVDARADLYALGVTLVELATGSRSGLSQTMDWTADTLAPPSSAASASETVSMEDLEGVEPAVPPGVPEWLAPAVARCLEHGPEERWPDMAGLAGALEQLDVTGPGLLEALGITPEPASPGRTDTNVDDARALIGRESELQVLEDLLAGPGLVTLLGPAGIGKSSLAAAAARARWEATGGQAWLCDLTEAHSLEGLTSAVARTLGVPLGQGDAATQLGHAIAGRGPLTLVLDNFEQLAQCAPTVEAWRSRALEARIILTSRVAVGLGTEIRVSPLSPQAAAALLTERARSRGAEVADDPDLPELARRLDGIPLALELAAGRLGVLSVADVLERLGLSMLSAGTADRHGTLQAALDWSWDLLSEPDRRALAQLSVFAGGFTVETAEGVLRLPQGSVLDAVSSLIDRSMIHPAGKGRFRLLSSVSAYAQAKLDDGEAARRRHGALFAGLHHHVGPSGSLEHQQTLATELENIVAACRYGVSSGDAEMAVGALEAAWLVYALTGPAAVASDLASAAVAATEEPAARMRALLYQGKARWAAGWMDDARASFDAVLALGDTVNDLQTLGVAHRCLGALNRQVGRIDDALDHHHRALDLARRTGDLNDEAMVLDNLALLHMHQGRMDEAATHYSRALALSRRAANLNMVGTVLGNMGLMHSYEGRDALALDHYERAITAQQQVGDRRGVGEVLTSLGALHRGQGRLAEARATYERALALHREVGHRRFEGIVLGNLGNVCRAEGRSDEAIGYWQASLAVHRETGNRRSMGVVLANLGHLQAALGRADQAKATFERALGLAREIGHKRLEGWVLILLALQAIERGAPAEAEAALDQAEPVLRDVRDPAILAELLAVRSEALLLRGDRAGALAALAEAEQIAPEGQADAAEAIARAKQKIGVRS